LDAPKRMHAFTTLEYSLGHIRSIFLQQCQENASDACLNTVAIAQMGIERKCYGKGLTSKETAEDDGGNGCPSPEQLDICANIVHTKVQDASEVRTPVARVRKGEESGGDMERYV